MLSLQDRAYPLPCPRHLLVRRITRIIEEAAAQPYRASLARKG